MMFAIYRGLTLFLVSICAAPMHLCADPHYINDREVQASIERAGTAMIEAGQTIENAAFLEQLQRAAADMPAPTPGALTVDGDDLYEQAADGVLVVAGLYLCGKCDNYHANCATGFVVSADGLVVTNHHVIDKQDNITLVARTRDGRVVPVTEVLASNKADDVALIRIGGEGPYKPLPIARDATVGEPVHTITHPSGRFYCYSTGEISRFFMAHNHGRSDVRRVQITAEFAKGSSGGPILNDLGQVVALVTTTDSVYYNTNDGKQENLQMVFYNCVPYESVLNLFAGEAE
jgi:S1-C subfamily serine protease